MKNKVELPHFDDYAMDYDKLVKGSTGFSGLDVSYFDEHKVKCIAQKFSELTTTKINYLNFGCGTGRSERFIRQYFPYANIYSVDISADSIRQAKERNNSLNNIQYFSFDTLADLQLPQMDIIFMANVLHHIPNNLQIDTLAYLKSRLKKEAFLHTFEHNPWNPATRWSFKICEFDQGCHMISVPKFKNLCLKAGFEKNLIDYVLFLPGPLAKFNVIEKYLTWLPLGAQYYGLSK